ncbi:MAG TPA: alpha/beta hydrolase [Granulicella sp.]|nr:alpha/beta hydrolase [Granulicella sp.]
MTRSRPPQPTHRPSQRPTPSPAAKSSPPRNPYALNPNPEVVDPRWLLKAIGLMVLLALVCGYLSLCVLFYQGQWQLVLHPSRSTPAPAAIAGTPIVPIHFGIDESAMPQLTGWWIPAPPLASQGPLYGGTTILYLPSGDGSLADSDAPITLAALHAAGLNVFAFDYRGFGQSAPLHPNQRRMQQDAAFSWQYLTDSRHLAPTQIVLFGTGVGAALATQLAAQHPQAPALILDAPRPNLLQLVAADSRAKLLPVRLLFHDRFELAPTLATLSTPKLLVANSQARQSSHPGSGDQTAALYRAAANPKFTLHLSASPADNPAMLQQAFTRFFDQYLPTSPDTKPLTAPQLPTLR